MEIRKHIEQLAGEVRMMGGVGRDTQQQHMVPISQLWTEEWRRMRGWNRLQSGDINTSVIVTFTSTSRKLQLHADCVLMNKYRRGQFCTHTPTLNQTS